MSPGLALAFGGLLGTGFAELLDPALRRLAATFSFIGIGVMLFGGSSAV